VSFILASPIKRRLTTPDRLYRMIDGKAAQSLGVGGETRKTSGRLKAPHKKASRMSSHSMREASSLRNALRTVSIID
jgi:hypothetical protein